MFYDISGMFDSHTKSHTHMFDISRLFMLWIFCWKISALSQQTQMGSFGVQDTELWKMGKETFQEMMPGIQEPLAVGQQLCRVVALSC